ncbi:FAD-binding oxidoreductase [Bordetella genomosp. 4]|uniref:FAD-binding oxidoreductase n=1 Tax=Bordetella genomosp. 4 TaxID=463044 RepID=UPI0015950014|nr:FAD-binding oxidoreductase [Bordetella genomosp. 4]
MIDERYLQDWSGTRYGQPLSLEKPGSVTGLAQWLKGCNESGVPVALQGGRTGVSGGAAPGDGEHILSLENLREVISFDRQAGVIVVESGMILADVQALVEEEGWTLPLDLGSRGSCQIGGNAATNAGGCRVIKYGNMRSMVLGVEAVLADGSIIGPPNELVKNNAGYSLTQLLVGSEGTLGVITKVALRLIPTPPVRLAALLAIAPQIGVDELLRHCRVGFGESLSAFEVMWPEYVEAALVEKAHVRRLPEGFDGMRAVLIEVEGQSETAIGARLEEVLSQLYEKNIVRDIVLPSSIKDGQELWAIRESVGEIQRDIRPYAGFDLGMPASQYDAFVTSARSNLASTGLPIKSYFFGHAGDGNLHAVIGPCPTDDVRACVEAALYDLLPAYTTTVTAEHGMGRKKKSMLGRARTQADIAAMIAIKRALDPKNILNPGRIFDL